ncbi:MAG TPA: hypothetical protein VFG91_06620 [Woeseiaceae bacterium]|nr:hypothetical protein [Woeseiaceae bacterium]
MKRLATALFAAVCCCGVAACAHRPAAPIPERDALQAPDCITATGSAEAPTGQWTDGADRATVTVSGEPCRRTFTLATTAALRDGRPDNPRTFAERPGQATVSTGNDLFDALYALARAELREASVASIRDAAFANGEPVPCNCFETGRLWTYVWTRDTAYAVDLALAAADPLRARNSLLFKLSERRGGGDVQIVQDTGSGGSYPISTDRVVWALAAEELLKYLDGGARDEFLAVAFEAVRNTVEHDRAVVYDPRDGLYRGETSFLDWREQSYPPWTADDTVHIGTSKALSTNVLHLRALEIAATLAREHGDSELADRYAGWAQSLAIAVRERFYLPDTGLFSSFIMTPRDPAPVRRYDLLGSALAVLSGVATPEQARAAVAGYPQLPKGPPVIWPQQPGVPIYHNRAVWPFVTAYWLRAAAAVRNDAAVNLAVASLMRGAALNLSNMENFEMVTGEPWVDDGELSGPVVNSQRQLWSIAGYLAMVHDVVFGLEAGQAGIRFLPYVTRGLRHDLFGNAGSLVLNNFPYRGHRITVVVRLPPVTGNRAGAYRVGEMRLNGEVISRDFIPAATLLRRNRITIDLVDTAEQAAAITLIDDLSDHEALFGPPAPFITGMAGTRDGVRVDFAIHGAAADQVAFNVYRDGVRRAAALPGSARSWADTVEGEAPGRCYTVEAYFLSSKNTSQRAEPECYRGPANERISRVPVREASNAGKKREAISVELAPRTSGTFALRFIYRNPGPINTGITCAVKHVEVRESKTGTVAAAGYAVMPHTGAGAPGIQGRSSPLRVHLRAGVRYTVTLSSDFRAVNMSAFQHFERYTGGAGGKTGPRNQADIVAVELRPLPRRD